MNKTNRITEQLVTLNVFYYMPDYPSLLQQYIWQTHDLQPKYPRIKRFLTYWDENIEATIESIVLAHADPLYGKVFYTHKVSLKDFL